MPGPMCCLFGVCCPPERQAEQLARTIKEAGNPEEAAAAILAVADLVPKGVGAKIRDAYRPIFNAVDAAGEGIDDEAADDSDLNDPDGRVL